MKSFFLRPVTLDEIVNIIENLKILSANINEISVKIIKLAKYHLAEPISYLMNSSFTAGRFRDILKESCIMPIFKSGDLSRCLIGDLFPCCLLSVKYLRRLWPGES